MKLITVFTLIASLLLSGCMSKKASFDQGTFEFVNTQAKDCVEKLSELAAENNEPYTFSFAYYVSSTSVPMINSQYTQSKKIGIPYFISPSRDNNHPGSAWRVCMSRHRALDPNILLPEYQESE
ncbi:hypothetical protein [Providencia burhodogranariea]|uniref:Lipoprotein n=1 Tax=Providencia burhodogranariea DSM 19968 TaxID=1141662 RepID=K8X866_9GAMM|nr:hypothetical protein [Providencia burhodogranariea]EKT64625.1 hypothetical protein OOA_02472 [Providencia burhodogranariea DSM 19968]